MARRSEVEREGLWLVVVTGWTGAGKTTLAELIGADLDATVASFDWLMSGLRALPDVWGHVESPREQQRRVGWNLLARVAEQQLRRGRSCVLDLVAREEPCREWRRLADRYDASFAVVECVCSDVDVHRSRVEGRRRDIPGWYELTWAEVERGRHAYRPLDLPKAQVDAVDPLAANLAAVRTHLVEASHHFAEVRHRVTDAPSTSDSATPAAAFERPS